MPFQLNDLHCHSNLSSCCFDQNLTPQVMLDFAEENGYHSLCLTDHLWDRAVEGASDWYAPQDIEHVRQSLPLPTSKGKMPFYFGCETELPACGRPAVSKEHFDLFDFIVIPVNHMHMSGLVRPLEINTPEKMARYVEDRLENLLMQDLPFKKIGLAHLTCSLMFAEGSAEDVVACMNEERLLRIFKGYARVGAGIELNSGCFENLQNRQSEKLLIYQIAKDAGCLFYCCSDAHCIEYLSSVPRLLPPVIQALGLSEKQQFTI